MKQRIENRNLLAALLMGGLATIRAMRPTRFAGVSDRIHDQFLKARNAENDFLRGMASSHLNHAAIRDCFRLKAIS